MYSVIVSVYTLPGHDLVLFYDDIPDNYRAIIWAGDKLGSFLIHKTHSIHRFLMGLSKINVNLKDNNNKQ